MIPLIAPASIYPPVIFITAMINLLAICLILLSCRCINMWPLTSFLSKYPWFKRFFKWHCYFWYLFIPSVIIHAFFALSVIGFPF